MGFSMGFDSVDWNNLEETWQASVKLRWLNSTVSKGGELVGTFKVLQQLYVSNLGNTEWRDVETVIE